MKQFATDVLKEVEALEKAFSENTKVNFELHWGEGEEVLQNFEDVTVTACLNDDEKPATRDNIAYYLVDSERIKGTDSVFGLASDIVNINEVVRCLELDKESLQEFYDTNIHDIRNMDYRDMTAEQRDNMGMFSDWHKDIYGRRPHDDDLNQCLVVHNFRESKSKEGTERE